MMPDDAEIADNDPIFKNYKQNQFSIDGHNNDTIKKTKRLKKRNSY